MDGLGMSLRVFDVDAAKVMQFDESEVVLSYGGHMAVLSRMVAPRTVLIRLYGGTDGNTAPSVRRYQARVTTVKTPTFIAKGEMDGGDEG
eukprot:709650-Rhodomonas_salina.1